MGGEGVGGGETERQTETEILSSFRVDNDEDYEIFLYCTGGDKRSL